MNLCTKARLFIETNHKQFRIKRWWWRITRCNGNKIFQARARTKCLARFWFLNMLSVNCREPEAICGSHRYGIRKYYEKCRLEFPVRYWMFLYPESDTNAIFLKHSENGSELASTADFCRTVAVAPSLF